MQNGFIVPARSRRAIYDTAAGIREAFRRAIGPGAWVPIDKLYELMPLALPGFRLEVCERSELGDDHGRTFPEHRLVMLREDVYEGMCRGVGRDRYTGAHELGHLFLHQSVGFARQSLRPGAPRYLDSEWQANTFASAFLIDETRLPACRSVEEVMSTFGVSEHAARIRFEK